jgi:hypothetical protein
VGLWIEGAAEHNLRDVDVGFGDGITAVVGVSGSGKSSLVFDTPYHELRRRFLEAEGGWDLRGASLSLGSPALRMRPARIRDIQGLSPAVAVAQNAVNGNPHSTVATATGIHPLLRVLHARFAQRRCPHCGEAANTASLDTQLATLASWPPPRRWRSWRRWYGERRAAMGGCSTTSGAKLPPVRSKWTVGGGPARRSTPTGHMRSPSGSGWPCRRQGAARAARRRRRARHSVRHLPGGWHHPDDTSSHGRKTWIPLYEPLSGQRRSRSGWSGSSSASRRSSAAAADADDSTLRYCTQNSLPSGSAIT